MDGLVGGWGIVEFGADLLVVGVHGGLGHGFGEVAVAGMVVVFIDGLLR